MTSVDVSFDSGGFAGACAWLGALAETANPKATLDTPNCCRRLPLLI
jgi:hypothetical protein